MLDFLEGLEGAIAFSAVCNTSIIFPRRYIHGVLCGWVGLRLSLRAHVTPRQG